MKSAFHPVLLSSVSSLRVVSSRCSSDADECVPDKFAWVNTDRLRWSKYLNVPMAETMPGGFPVNTLAVCPLLSIHHALPAATKLMLQRQAQRALAAISTSHPSQLTDAMAALFHALWVRGDTTAFESAEGLTAVLETVLGREAAGEVMEQVHGRSIHFYARRSLTCSSSPRRPKQKPRWARTRRLQSTRARSGYRGWWLRMRRGRARGFSGLTISRRLRCFWGSIGG